jgi:hypothetical protein
MSYIKIFYSVFIISLLSGNVDAQSDISQTGGYVTVIAGKEYQKSKFYQWLFGKNRRQEWGTPVRVPIVLLDTIYGGLVPYQKGGGGESKSLRLKSLEGKEYALRSIKKNREKSIPKFFKNTWYGNLIQDGVSMSHPYGAFALPVMIEHANIFHSKPRLVYIPKHNALDTFNAQFANNIYLLEERADGDWSNAQHLGNFKKYYSTISVKEILRDNNQLKADQYSFIKARLFDILISDVDRHYGNWRWGLADTGLRGFKPIPGDRDQAFFTHDGLLTKLTLAITRRRFMQNFDNNIKNVKRLTLTSKDRKLDEFFTNELNKDEWLKAAAALQESLTDSIIIRSISELPPEVFAISGREIISKLKQRRDKLQHYAAQYYLTLAKEIDINGSNQKEHFEVKKISDNQIAVSVYRINNKGEKDIVPYYKRTFNSNETKRITLYGFDGDDVFDVYKDTKPFKIIIQKGVNKAQFPDAAAA